jgi:Vam6/Vps39-like protein vacuolar protein sorting-associated protein 39
MFGGPVPKPAREAPSSSSSSSEHGGDVEGPGPSGPAAAPAGGMVSKFKSPLDAIRPSGSKDPETVSISSRKDKPRIGSYLVSP